MAVAAPNFSFGGLHESEKRKPKPNSWNAGHAPRKRDTATPARRIRTRRAAANVMARKAESPSLSRERAALRLTAASWRDFGAETAVAVKGLSKACPKDRRAGGSASSPP